MSYSDVLNARKAALQARLEQTDWNSDVISELAEVNDAIGSAGGGGASQAEIQAAIEAASNLDGLEGSLSAIVTNTADIEALLGATNETAPASDTAPSAANGRLQRIAQRITSLIALLPASLGTKTAANSFSATLASDGTFATLTGSATETAPASDTASSGLNGRLQRIAQRITSLLALIPPDLTVDRSLGAATSKVVKASSGRMYSIACTNLNTSTRYLQFFDSTSTPGGGATPISSHPVYGNGGMLILDVAYFGGAGSSFSTGITWGFSTTALTYTAGTATDAIVVVRYV